MTSPGKDKEFIWGKKRNKTWILIVAIAVLAVAALVGGVLYFGKKTGKPQENANTTNNLVRRAIDGVLVEPDQANFYPVAVMIENLVSVRPQSGLSHANVVYEALAEGGITRFMAVFAGKYDIAMIGPVRSSRLYYLDWAKELNALNAHAGGSPEAISAIKKYSIIDLDQFYNAQYFWRDKDRAAPHNLFTSSQLLAFALRDKKIAQEGSYDRWLFKDDAALLERPADAKTITIDFSTFNYKVEYQYDREQNDYKRFQAGQPHVDRDGTVIRTKNVVVQYVKTRLADEQRLSMETIGEGDVIVFRDGNATLGRWKKTAREERTRYYDTNGNEVSLNAGTTWVEVVPSDRTIQYN